MMPTQLPPYMQPRPPLVSTGPVHVVGQTPLAKLLESPATGMVPEGTFQTGGRPIFGRPATPMRGGGPHLMPQLPQRPSPLPGGGPVMSGQSGGGKGGPTFDFSVKGAPLQGGGMGGVLQQILGGGGPGFGERPAPPSMDPTFTNPTSFPNPPLLPVQHAPIPERFDRSPPVPYLNPMGGRFPQFRDTNQFLTLLRSLFGGR